MSPAADGRKTGPERIPTSAAGRFFRAALARAYARVVGMSRDPTWIFFDTVLPLLAVASYVFLYKSMQAPRAFLGFVILGSSMIAFWLNVLWGMATMLYWEKEMGRLEQYLLAPTSRMALLLGLALGGMFNTSLRALVTFIAGSIIFKVPFSVDDPLGLVAIFILTMAALYGLGMLGSSAFLLYGREAYYINNLLQEPVFLGCGVFFPVKSLGLWVGTIFSLIPITLGLDGMRQILYGSAAGYGFIPYRIEMIVLLALAVVYVLLARWALRTMENLSRREGRLTLRWQ